MRPRLIVAGLLALLVFSLVSCGTSNVSTLTPGLDQDRQLTGVSLDGFEVIRFNENGKADPALNDTLKLDLQQIGGQTGLVISVTDTNVNTIAVDVKYDAGKLHPTTVEFHGLLGSEDEVLSAGFLASEPGVAGVAASGLHDMVVPSVDGQFATVLFSAGALRGVSAATDVHQNPLGVATPIGPDALPNLWVIDEDELDTTVEVRWTAAWHIGDGDQNSEVNASDIARIASNYRAKVSEDFAAIVADYDHNGEVNASDLARIANFYREATHEYVVQAGDDEEGATLTDIAVIEWNDALPPLEPVAAPNLDTVLQYWSVEFTDISDFTFQQLQALDVNTNQSVKLVITPRRNSTGETLGAPSEIVVPAGEPPLPPLPVVTVNAVTIRAEGASGGLDTGDVFNADNSQASVVANSDLNLTLSGISGQYSSQEGGSGPFTPDTPLPADMTQAMYDDTLAAVRAALMWSDPDHGGAPGFRRTSDWLTFAVPPPAQGDPGLGTVFPDDDPESTGANSEGRLTVTLNPVAEFDTGNAYRLAMLGTSFTVRFDVTADEEASLLGEVLDNSGQPMTELIRNQNNLVQVELDYGTLGAPTPPESSAFQMVRYNSAGLVVGTPFEFNFVPNVVSAAGDFTIRTLGEEITVLAIVPSLAITDGATYGFRIRINGTWSSANKPEQLLTTAPPPPPVPLWSIPQQVPHSASANRLQIFLTEETKIRRQPFGQLNTVTQEFVPILIPGTNDPDYAGYNDVLKTTGEEFSLSVGENGTSVYPVVIIALGNNPDVITFESRQPPNAEMPGSIWTDGQLQNEAGDFGWLIVPQRNPSRITIDIGVLPKPIEDDDPTQFCFKLFNPDGSSVGAGTFTMKRQLDPQTPAPSVTGPNDWGVNVFNRGATDGVLLGGRDFGGPTSKNLVQGNSIATDTPDVIWFEFADGWVFDVGTGQDPQYTLANVHAIIEEVDPFRGNRNMAMALRVVGINGGNRYLAIHTLRRNDFSFDTAFNELPGNLTLGQQYNVHLKDPTRPGNWQTSYTKRMLVGSYPPPAP